MRKQSLSSPQGMQSHHMVYAHAGRVAAFLHTCEVRQDSGRCKFEACAGPVISPIWDTVSEFASEVFHTESVQYRLCMEDLCNRVCMNDSCT